MKTLISIKAFYESGRLCIAPICMLFLLSKNVNIQDIALIKSIQAITMVILDVPAGMLISCIGSYSSSVLSIFFIIFGFIFFLFGYSFNHFLIAEFFYSLSILLWPVAFSNYTIEYMDIEKKASEISYISHLSFSTCAICTLITGFIGSYFFKFSSIIPYLFSIILFLISGAFLFISKKNHHSFMSKRPIDRRRTLYENITQLPLSLKKNQTSLSLAFFLLVGVQFFFSHSFIFGSHFLLNSDRTLI